MTRRLNPDKSVIYQKVLLDSDYSGNLDEDKTIHFSSDFTDIDITLLLHYVVDQAINKGAF